MCNPFKKLDDALKASAKAAKESDYNYQSWHPADNESWPSFLDRMRRDGHLTEDEAAASLQHYKKTSHLERKTVHRDNDDIPIYWES